MQTCSNIYGWFVLDDVSSISGSESEDSDKEDSDVENSAPSEKKEYSPTFTRGRHSKAFFENSSNKVFSVYKCLLHSKKETVTNSSLVSSLNNLMNSPRKWLVIMLGKNTLSVSLAVIKRNFT